MDEGVFWSRLPAGGMSTDWAVDTDIVAERFLADLCISDCNDAFAVFHGFPSADECIDMPLSELFPSPERAAAYMKTILSSGRVVQSVRHRSGARMLMVSHLIQEAGKIRGIQGLNIEQTGIADNAEDSVPPSTGPSPDARLSTQLLLQSIEESRECMVLADLTGTIIYANSAKAALMGLSKEELIGTNVTSFGLRGQEELEKEIEFATLKDGSWSGQLLRRRYDGKLVPVQMRTSLIHDDTGQPVAQIRTFNDVSEQADLETKLATESDSLKSLISDQMSGTERSQEGYRLLYETSPVASIVTDLDGTIREANPAACDLLQSTRQDLIDGRLPSLFRDAGQWPEYVKDLPPLRKVDEREIEYRAENNSVITVRQSCVLLGSERKDAVLVHFLRDITEAKRLEQEAENARRQMVQADRLASIGKLVAGVAHELNNPLTGVLTFSHMLRRDVRDTSRTATDLDTIIEAADRCKEIVRGLLDFSRQGESNKKLCDLSLVLSEAINLVRNQALVKSINIVENIDAGLPPIVIDPHHIEQVAVNLICNALDAMDEGGTLTITMRSAESKSSSCLEFQVEDTGCGIPEASLNRIFDPFFTTKPPGQGTGLGLSIAYGIIEQHGGSITATSVIDRGSKFTVQLPVTGEE